MKMTHLFSALLKEKMISNIRTRRFKTLSIETRANFLKKSASMIRVKFFKLIQLILSEMLTGQHESYAFTTRYYSCRGIKV